MGEITVTARRRREALQDVPLAISAVSGEELNSQRLDRLADYAYKVPNFWTVQQNTRVSTLSVRGLGGNANNDGAESGVGLIVDNVFYTHVGFSWLDFIDLEGVEVVRGPQGTLLGKNTTVGAVLVRTRPPTFEPEFGVDVTAGDNERYQVRAFASGPLVQDRLAGRLTVGADHGGGWVTNAYDGERYLDNDRYSVRGQLLFTPASNVTSRLIGEIIRSEEYNNFYPVTGDVNFNLNLDGSVFSPISSWSARMAGLFGYTPNYDAPHNADLDTQDRIVSRVDGVSNELNWDVGDLTFSSITAWRQLYFRPYNDSDYSPFAILRSGFDVDVEQFSQEFRLANAPGSRLDWQVGVYYLNVDLSSDNRSELYEDASLFFLGVPVSAALNGVETSQLGQTETTSAAVFGQASWRVTDRFDLTAGLRYTREDKDASVVGTSSGGVDLPAALAPYRALVTAALGGTGSNSGSRSDESISWLINPSYRLNDNILLYASASYGEKSGAANTAAAPGVPLFTEPEESLDFEAGFKSAWDDGRARLNLNLYNNSIRGYQGTQYYSAVVARPYLANVGEVRLRGVEIETGWAITRDFSVSLSGAYNDAEYVSFENALAPYEYQEALLAGTGSRALSLTGYQLVGAPKVTVQAGVDYSRPIGGGLEAFGYASAQHRSRVNYYNPRSEYGWQDAFTLVNAGIGVRTGDERWSALLWSKNLFDETYILGGGTASSSLPIISVYGEPRTYGLTLSARF